MKLSVIGRGVRPWEHLTLEGLRALKDADVVLGIEPDQGAWQALTQEFAIPPIRSLEAPFRDGIDDEKNYELFKKFILEASESYEHVAIIIAGHPRLGVTLLQWLSKNNFPSHIEIDVIDGLSSLDIMCNELERDPLEKGTVVLDANQILLSRSLIDSTLDVFIFHAFSLEREKTRSQKNLLSHGLYCLVEHLNHFYEKDKKIILCKAANVTGGASEYISITLDKLFDHALLIDPGTTIFIPGAATRKINSKYISKFNNSQASSQMLFY